jgi:hypothetical protein
MIPRSAPLQSGLRVLIAPVFCLTGAFMARGGAGFYSDRFGVQAAEQIQIPSGPPTLVPTLTCTPDWSPGADLPITGVGLVGVFRPMGSFMEWAAEALIRQATSLPIRLVLAVTPGLPSRPPTPTPVNNMACGVLSDAGTPYIYCVGGSQVSVPGTFDRVFRYDLS